MSDHFWGEENFDWSSLQKAVNHYWFWMYHFAGMCLYTKEKYGTLRLENFWLGKVYLTIYIKPYSFSNILCKTINTIFPQKVIAQYQLLVFNIATLIAIKKWPHIKNEIMDDIYFDDYLYDWVKRKVRYVSNWHKYV